MAIEIFIYFLIMFSAVPVGFLLAWLCDDEVVYAKKWFKIISFVLVLLILGSFFIYYDESIILVLIYFLIVTLIGLYKAK